LTISTKLAAVIALCCVSFTLQSQASTDSTALHELFAGYWETQLSDNPEFATYIGDNRYSDRLHDLSAQATARRKAERVNFEKKLSEIDATGISAEDQISLDILRFQTHQAIVLDGIYGDLPFSADDSPFAITQMGGIQLDLPQLLRATPFQTRHDYDMFLARLNGLPTYLAQETDLLTAGMKSGWMPAAIALRSVPAQFAPLLVTSLEKNPLYQPFVSMPATIPVAEQETLRSAARDAILHRVVPALGRLQAFLTHDYLPAASTHIAASDLPGKAAYYQAMLISFNTTLKTPQEIHQIGLNEVDKIEQAMRAVMKQTGFKGTPAEFNKYMNTDKKFFFTSGQAMLTSYRDIAKRIDARLPELFETLPRLPYGVRAMMASEGDAMEHYTGGTLTGTRAGYFEANINNLKRRPNWSMEDLTLHEAVPGHHLQTARAGELTGMPTFRRAYWNSGYGEGWALYAESLGPELGMYATPQTRYGYLSAQIFRASRLVVDTGIHAFGMTRDEAIAYLIQHAAVTHDLAVAEVDRYIVWPGQATSYKLGQLEIIALRDKAQQALGAKFDIRRFNNQVVDHGALPLDTLDKVINQWIVSQ